MRHDELARGLRERLQASRVTIRLDPGRDYPVAGEATAAGVAAIGGDASVPQASAATVRWVARHLRTLAVDDVEASELRPPAALLDAYAIRAFVMAPIVRAGVLYGTVSVHEVGRPRAWTAAELAAAERVAAEVQARLGPDRVEPAPQRIRALLGGRVVLDTTNALHVWEGRSRPALAIPVADVDPRLLAGELIPAAAIAVHGEDEPAGLAGTVRIAWDALDAWFEEDERMHVGPRSPYTRVDALRSSRHVRVELAGVVLAESRSPVALFETGLPARWYLDPSAVELAHLTPSGTVTACPYKGVASDWWSARVHGEEHADVAWSYAFPTREAAPIAGLIAFDDAKVDIVVEPPLRP